MKVFIAILLLAAVVTAEFNPTDKEQIRQYENLCASELNVSHTYIKQLNVKELFDNSTGKCFVKCMFGKLGIFDEANGLNVDKFYNYFHTESGHGDSSDDLYEKTKVCIENNKHNWSGCDWVADVISCLKSKKD